MQSMRQEGQQRKVLDSVKSGNVTCNEIAEATKIEKSQVYNHLRRLVTQGVIKTQRGNGWTKYYPVGESPVLLERFWKSPIVVKK
jgi:predicted ArsR family transcriptional regulator